MSPATGSFDHDVVIVGFGPSGVVAANLLGAAGVRTLAIERERDVYHRARAVTVDGSTMRTFQSIGLDEALKADMDVTTALRWKTYAGIEFLRVKPTTGPWGHEPSYMIFQPAVEATLRQGVERYPSVVDVRFGHEFVGLAQDADGVDVSVRDVATDATSTVRARYVIAADGGSSATRQAVGAAMSGETRSRTWIVVDAKIKRWWPERELLTFWSDPVRPVVDIPLAMDHHRWEIPLGPDERKEDFDSDAAVWRLLTPLGIDESKVEVLGHAFYNHHVRRADRWRSGRVVLVGDAAHLMPPWAGQGMQSGIRDAVNVTWKLTAILRGGVDDAILDTYQVEREPHVQAVTNASVALGKLIETEKGPGLVVRNRVLPIIARTPVLGDRFRSSLDIGVDLASGFLSGTPDKRNPLGRMLPQPFVANQTGHRGPLDDALGTGLVIIGMDVDPRDVLTPAQQQAWEPYAPRYVVMRSARAVSTGDADLVDFEDVLAPWLKRYGARVVVVRPDRFVAASDTTGLDVPALLAPAGRDVRRPETGISSPAPSPAPAAPAAPVQRV